MKDEECHSETFTYVQTRENISPLIFSCDDCVTRSLDLAVCGISLDDDQVYETEREEAKRYKQT